MEENKKVFIRGHKGREKDVVDILTGLGANAPKYEYGNGDDYLYFINHNNEIGVALINSEVGAIIMDNYKEIELPPRPWEDGDTLIDNGYPKDYAVFRKYNNDDTFEAYFVLAGKTADFDATAYVEDYHCATTEELKAVPRLFTFLMGALNEAGLCLPKKVSLKPYKL